MSTFFITTGPNASIGSLPLLREFAVYVGDITSFNSYEALLAKIQEVAKQNVIANPIGIVEFHPKFMKVIDPNKKELKFLDYVKEIFPSFHVLERQLLINYSRIEVYIV